MDFQTEKAEVALSSTHISVDLADQPSLIDLLLLDKTAAKNREQGSKSLWDCLLRGHRAHWVDTASIKIYPSALSRDDIEIFTIPPRLCLCQVTTSPFHFAAKALSSGPRHCSSLSSWGSSLSIFLSPSFCSSVKIPLDWSAQSLLFG